MSDQTDDFDDDADGDKPDESGPKALRAQLKKLQAEKSALESENGKLKSDQRKHSVSQALEKHGARPSLAKFYDKTESSDDDVLAWLKENGEDFGWSESGDESDEDDDTAKEAGRISEASSRAPQRPNAPRVDPEFIRTAPREKLIEMGILAA